MWPQQNQFKPVQGLALAIFAIASPALAEKPAVRALPDSVVQEFTKAGIASADFSVFAMPIEPYAARRPSAYSHNGARPINPASVAKVFTTGYALNQLQSTYRFRTGFHVVQEPIDGVLAGPLYIKGTGDPAFITADLWSSLRAMRSKGLRVIEGNLVLDNSEFIAPGGELVMGGGEDAFDDAPHRAYHAEPNALLLNFGAMSIDIVPRADAVQIVPEEAPASWAFVSEVRLVQGACGAWKNSMSIDFSRVGQNAVVTVRGDYPRRCGQQRLPIRIPPQDWLWADWFKEIWAQLGGEFKGQVVIDRMPQGTVAYHTHFGKPLAELVKQINKWSSNVMSRHLELAVAGTPQRFNRDLLAWLGQQGVGTAGWFFENGSGLSRSTRIDAQGLGQFLTMMAQRPDFPDFLASFPRAGADGTLHRRVTNVGGYAYLKTGSLNGVRSLGGYVRDTQGQWWAVGVMVASPRAFNAWPPMEAVIEFLHKGGGPG